MQHDMIDPRGQVEPGEAALRQSVPVGRRVAVTQSRKVFHGRWTKRCDKVSDISSAASTLTYSNVINSTLTSKLVNFRLLDDRLDGGGWGWGAGPRGWRVICRAMTSSSWSRREVRCSVYTTLSIAR